jgi:cytochrome c oxidase cbb3-type subunit 3
MRNSWIFILPLIIIVAITFIVLYDDTAQEAVQASLSLSQKQAIENLGELDPSESTILKYMSDDTMMDTMRVVFITHCSSCHGIEGTGIAGPNLCDDSYTVVKNLPDIYEAIAVGNIKRGMTPFSSTLSNTEMILLSAYVAKLRGSASEGKFPEGTPIEPWN